MTGPRHYSAGTERALFHLAKGTCYFPGCDEPIIRWVDAEPVVSVDMAHIRGAKPGSARFDQSMNDDQRRAFPNLIFLCTAHHKIVDRLHADEYPADLLETWKATNEELAGNSPVAANEGDLEQLLTELARLMDPYRSVDVDLLAGLSVNVGETTMASFAGHAALLDINAHLHDRTDVVIIAVRNVGTLPVEVTQVDLHWDIQLPGTEALAGFSLMGRDDFPYRNPPLPHRLLDGARATWFTLGDTVRAEEERLLVAGEPVALRGEVSLATGETVSSDRIPWAQVRAARFASEGL